MRRSRFDERQQQTVGKAASAGFYVMFIACAASIVIQLSAGMDIKYVLGETAALSVGGIIYLAGCVRSGIWPGHAASPVQNLLGSVVCSGVFSVLYGVVLYSKGAEMTVLAKAAAVFFAVITIICFLCLTFLESISHKKREEQESRYSE